MKLLIALTALLVSLTALADQAKGTAEIFSMTNNRLVIKFTGPIVSKLTHDMNRVKPKKGYLQGQNITCFRKVCTLMIADKSIGKLAARPSVEYSKFTKKDEALVYDFVGTRSQSTLAVYGEVAEVMFKALNNVTFELRMSSSGTNQKVGSRYTCERRLKEHNCTFFIEDKSTGKIGPASML